MWRKSILSRSDKYNSGVNNFLYIKTLFNFKKFYWKMFIHGCLLNRISDDHKGLSKDLNCGDVGKVLIGWWCNIRQVMSVYGWFQGEKVGIFAHSFVMSLSNQYHTYIFAVAWWSLLKQDKNLPHEKVSSQSSIRFTISYHA